MKKIFHSKSDTQVPTSNESAQDEKLSEEDLRSNNAEVLADSNKSIIWAIIRQLKVGESVKHQQLPTFVLQPRSLLEKLADSFVHPQLTLDLADIPDPLQRFVSVTRLFLAGLHYRVPGVKNPLNPVIGEIFRCKWDNPDSESVYIAEQISHHPPHSAFVYYNIKKGIAINTNLEPTYVKFFGNSAETHMNGLMRLYLLGKNFDYEVYEITFPSILLKGILFGTLVYEMVGKTSITCQKTGFSAEIEWKPKSLFKGKYNSIVGKIKQDKKEIYTINGFWDAAMTITDSRTKETTVLVDTAQQRVQEKMVAPKEQQAPNESRRLWEDVIAGMLKGYEDEALNAKRKLEAIQRADENERHTKNIEWIPKLFIKNSEGIYYYHKWDEVVQQISAVRSGKI